MFGKVSKAIAHLLNSNTNRTITHSVMALYLSNMGKYECGTDKMSTSLDQFSECTIGTIQGFLFPNVSLSYWEKVTQHNTGRK